MIWLMRIDRAYNIEALDGCGDIKDTTARAGDRRRWRVAFRVQKADAKACLELMTKRYKEATRDLDETVFQLAVTNEELRRKKKEVEERAAG